MKDSSQNIRYMGFNTTKDGGRRLDFSVTHTGQEPAPVTVEVAGLYFAGDERLLVQECVGLCYSKVKGLYDRGDNLPGRMSLTAVDVQEYRDAQSNGRRKTRVR